MQYVHVCQGMKDLLQIYSLSLSLDKLKQAPFLNCPRIGFELDNEEEPRHGHILDSGYKPSLTIAATDHAPEDPQDDEELSPQKGCLQAIFLYRSGHCCIFGHRPDSSFV